MIDLHTPATVRAMDEAAIAAGTPSLVLMERAATHLAHATARLAGHAYGLRVGVLCGRGSNGGDGLAAARLLHAAGAQPVVHVVGGADQLRGDAAVQRDRLSRLGGRFADSAAAMLAGADIVIDALLGTGASGPPRDEAAAAIAAVGAAPAVPVVACDVPSGVDAATGAVAAAAVTAHLTVTFGAHKVGLWLWPARGHCGRIVLADIGLDGSVARPAALALEASDVARLLPAPPATVDKRTQGVVMVLAGSPGMSGAATLVARGALAAGAGLVTVATSPATRALVAPTVPEVLTVDLPEDDADAAFDRLADHLEGADVLAVGPGLGHAERTVSLVRRLVREVDLPIVLDADGINAFRGAGDALADHKSSLLTLTPHVRELRRVAPASDEDVWAQRLSTVPACARRWDAVVVAKGPASLVAAPDGRCWITPTGTSALATGGTGDVLTGMTATLVAQDPRPDAVAAAVWLHGLAGEEAAAAGHARSVTALDVAAAVPAALRRLEEAT